MNRRSFTIGSLGSVAALAGVASAQPASSASPGDLNDPDATRKRVRGGRLKQSVCRWCFGGLSVDELCSIAAGVGLRSVELLGENEWDIPKKYDLTCAVANGPGGIQSGWNRLEHHEKLIAESERLLPLVAAAGLPNMIVFSGNRAGMDDAEGLRNCVTGLRQILPTAERVGVTVVMELLNSKRDHRDYMCDRTPWGVDLVEQLASDRFRLLYDIYHMQIQEGDVIATIREHHAAIGHYHTAGVPGRRDLDDAQELRYAAISAAIADTGFDGYFGQEFMPKGDPAAALRNAALRCTV